LSITILPNSSSFDSLEPGLMPLEYGGAAVGFLRQRDAGPGRTNGIQYPMALRISSSSAVRPLVLAHVHSLSGLCDRLGFPFAGDRACPRDTVSNRVSSPRCHAPATGSLNAAHAMRVPPSNSRAATSTSGRSLRPNRACSSGLFFRHRI
jgi:hypothetical protein